MGGGIMTGRYDTEMEILSTSEFSIIKTCQIPTLSLKGVGSVS
jgi:hypothetical protein